MGTRLAAMKIRKTAAMPVGSSVTCLSTPSSEAHSAATAATKPSWARRPLISCRWGRGGRELSDVAWVRTQVGLWL